MKYIKYVSFLSCWLWVAALYSQAPSISNFDPKIAQAGASVTLTGVGFNTTPANNVVHFGSIRANVTSASATQLVVEVPTGTSADKITVLNIATNLLGQTSLNFYPTFAGGSRIIPGSFRPHEDLSVDNFARTVRMADIDGDGWLDIVSASSREISIFRNLAFGGTLTSSSFASKIELNSDLVDTGGSGMLDFGFTDLDNDGKLDLYFSLDINPAFGSILGAVGIYRNTSTAGTISFEPVTLLDATARISYVAAGDFDGDGRQELLAGRGTSCGGPWPYFFVYQNLSSPGNLSFGSEVNISNTTGACTYERMVIADINGDNKLDIGVQRSFETAVSIIINQSTSGVINTSTFDPNPVLINGANTLALSDFDGDNLPELITHNEGNNTGIALRPNISTATNLAFADSIPYFSNSFREGETAIADLNGDGKKDIAIAADWSQDWVSILENDFDGTWNEQSFKQPIRLKTKAFYPITLDIGDLNHDGKPDIVTANQNAFLSIIENASQLPPKITTVSSYQAQVGETITITGQYFAPTPAENKVRFGTVLATVLTASPTELTVEVPQGSAYDRISVSVGILSAKSPGKFGTSFGPGSDFSSSSFAAPVIIPLTNDLTDLDIGDLDNDGKVDILARDITSSLEILRNESTTGILNTSSFSGVTNSVVVSTRMELEDLHGDGYLDIVGSSQILQNSSGTGLEAIEFNASLSTSIMAAREITLADVNQDGLMDQMATSNTNTMRVLESFITYGNFQNSTSVVPPFPTQINFTKASVSGFITSGDLDGDGWDDMVGTNPSTDNIAIFRNLGISDIITVGSFDNPVEFALGDNPQDVASGDLDRDGKIDLAIANFTDQTVTVLHNQSTVGNLDFDLYTYPLSASPLLLRLSDLDGDGRPEIISMNATGSFSILKNNADPLDNNSFAMVTTYTFPSGIGDDFEIADLDDDHRPDLVIATSNPNQVLLYKNLISTSTNIVVDQQPTDVTVCDGDAAMLSVTASGTTNLTYQWQEDQGSGFVDLTNSGPFSGVNMAILSISSTTSTMDNYVYRCMISGDFATDVISTSAFLSVFPIPSVPLVTNGSGCVNTSIIISASGSSDGTYRWYDVPSGGSPLPGEVNSSFSTPAISAPTNYYVSVIESGCESTRNEVKANILEPAVITSQPASLAINSGDPASFSVSATGDSLSYQWQKDQTDIPGATTNTLTLGSAQPSDDGSYRCEVSNTCSAVLSTAVNLAVSVTLSLERDNAELKVYPNPIIDQMIIKLPKGNHSVLHVQIHDLFGSYIYQKEMLPVDNQLSVDLATRKAGIYVLKIYSANNVIATKPLFIE